MAAAPVCTSLLSWLPRSTTTAANTMFCTILTSTVVVPAAYLGFGDRCAASMPGTIRAVFCPIIVVQPRRSYGVCQSRKDSIAVHRWQKQVLRHRKRAGYPPALGEELCSCFACSPRLLAAVRGQNLNAAYVHRSLSLKPIYAPRVIWAALLEAFCCRGSGSTSFKSSVKASKPNHFFLGFSDSLRSAIVVGMVRLVAGLSEWISDIHRHHRPASKKRHRPSHCGSDHMRSWIATSIDTARTGRAVAFVAACYSLSGLHCFITSISQP